MLRDNDIKLFQKAEDVFTFTFYGNVVDKPDQYFRFSDYSFEVSQISTFKNSDYNVSHFLWGICQANTQEIMERLIR